MILLGDASNVDSKVVEGIKNGGKTEVAWFNDLVKKGAESPKPYKVLPVLGSGSVKIFMVRVAKCREKISGCRGRAATCARN